MKGTASIAREAGSSESQLIRYFGGKAGLLEAIFNESWTALNAVVEQYECVHSRSRISGGSFAINVLRSAADSLVVTSVNPSRTTTTRSRTP